MQALFIKDHSAGSLVFFFGGGGRKHSLCGVICLHYYGGSRLALLIWHADRAVCGGTMAGPIGVRPILVV